MPTTMLQWKSLRWAEGLVLLVNFLITEDIGLSWTMRAGEEEFCCETIYGVCWFCSSVVGEQ